MAKQLGEYFRAFARNRGVAVAEHLAKVVRQVLSVQAPTRITRGGNLVAATRATPFAPPRRITGRLQDSVKVQRTARGAKLTVYAPYAMPLEHGTKVRGFPHKFLAVAMEQLGLRGRNR